MDFPTLMSMLERGEEPAVVAHCQARLKKRPTDAVANQVMAMIHGAYNRDAEALPYLQRACYAAPTDPSIWFMLGNVTMTLRKHKESAAAYRQCLKLSPGDVAASDGLAKSLISLGKLDEAQQIYFNAIASNPQEPLAWNNLVQALQLIGKLDDALTHGREALARFPNDSGLLEFVAYTSNFSDRIHDEEVKALHTSLGQAFARERAGAPVHPISKRTITRGNEPLRIGFLSGDYSTHACATFMHGPLVHFDRADITPICYSTQHHTDGGADPFRAACTFRDCHNLTVDGLAAALAADQLDIIIDCNGLTQGQRLRSLLPRIAPIQCTWLGYPNTTGLPTMDYRIVDALTDPPGAADTHASEQLARLPGCFLCFNPARNVPLPPFTRTQPASTQPIVFGSFNRITKVSPRTWDIWCSVLRAVPNSTFLVKMRIDTPEMRAESRLHFTSRGIDPTRILFSPYAERAGEHHSLYAHMDIALDSFPYNGTTTTCEALWMGVPVLTLAGTNHRSRVGVSLLTCLGLNNLIAADEAGFITIAKNLAENRAALHELKQSLRPRMEASPLCDAPAYAARFANLLWDLHTKT